MLATDTFCTNRGGTGLPRAFPYVIDPLIDSVVGVGVNVSVAVSVGVKVSVAVGVSVAVIVGVGVKVSVAVGVGVSVGVGDGVMFVVVNESTAPNVIPSKFDAIAQK